MNDYSFIYGQLNGVVILLLWLYVTNGAIVKTSRTFSTGKNLAITPKLM